MNRVISYDLESCYGTEFSVVDLGYWHYARDPRCNPYLISVCDGKESWAGTPGEFNFSSLEGATLVSHNRPFDSELSIAAMERGDWVIPGLKQYGNTFWECSLDMSAYVFGVRSLKDAVKIGLGLDVSKAVRDRAKDKTPDDMKREGFWDDMLIYGRQDAQNCWQLWDKHNHKWPEFERRLSRQTMEQGRYGVRVDVPALHAAIDQLNRIIFTATNNLPWIARGNKPASPIGIAEECRRNNIPSPPVKARDPEAAQAWEDEYAPRFKFVLALKNIRKAKKTLATLETIKLRLRDDETIAFSLKYAGAGTLRWAGDSGVNFQNFNKEPLFIDADYSFIFDKKATRPLCDEFDHDHAGACSVGALKNGIKFFDFRGLIIARPGMKLGPVDLAQIEPRVLNYLAGNKELLELVRQGMAIYEAHARKTMGWTGGDLKSMNKMLYALAKARVLGLGYGCGWEKFIQLAAIYGIDITEGDEQFAIEASVDQVIHQRVLVETTRPHRRFSDRLVTVREWRYVTAPEGTEIKIDPYAVGDRQDCVFVKTTIVRRGKEQTVIRPFPVYGMRSRVTVEEFRRTNPLIQGMQKRLQEELERSVGSDLVVEGPHGQSRTYRDVRCEKRIKIDKETGEEREKTVYTVASGMRREIVYGGLLLENLIQWVSRMVFAERELDLDDQLKAQDPRQRVLFTVHDEAVPEIVDPEDEAPKVKKWLEDVMSVTPSWLGDCPLGAEAKITGRYGK